MDPLMYGTDGTDPEEDSGVLEAQDTLDFLDGGPDVLDTGWSPAERPWAVMDWGTTGTEELAGEGLTARLQRELSDARPIDGDGLGDASDSDGELIDEQVGQWRAGRLVEAADGGLEDVEPELYALDLGVDSGAASAEEAAVHVIGEDDDSSPGWTDR
jgi:hypothetical protein